jgi:hypothetical protein
VPYTVRVRVLASDSEVIVYQSLLHSTTSDDDNFHACMSGGESSINNGILTFKCIILHVNPKVLGATLDHKQNLNQIAVMAHTISAVQSINPSTQLIPKADKHQCPIQQTQSRRHAMTSAASPL